jgi:hypothetical protein
MASNELKQYYDDKLKNVYQCDFNELNADTVKAISNSLSFALWKSNKAFKEFGKACNVLAIEKEQTRYKIKFDSVSFLNRWKQRRLSRNANWTIIGVSVWWSQPTKYCYKFSFFGLEMRIYFNEIKITE